jgi:rubrerythrin
MNKAERKAKREEHRKNPLRNKGYAELVWPKKRKKGKIKVRACLKCGEMFSTTSGETRCPSCS